MARKYPTNVLDQAQQVLDAWKQIDEALVFGDLGVTAMETALAQANSIRSQINAVEAQLTDLRNQRDNAQNTIWDYTKRVRTGVKSIYGDDSSEYEMVGGTRLSERDSYTTSTPA